MGVIKKDLGIIGCGVPSPFEGGITGAISAIRFPQATTVNTTILYGLYIDLKTNVTIPSGTSGNYFYGTVITLPTLSGGDGTHSYTFCGSAIGGGWMDASSGNNFVWTGQAIDTPQYLTGPGSVTLSDLDSTGTIITAGANVTWRGQAITCPSYVRGTSTGLVIQGNHGGTSKVGDAYAMTVADTAGNVGIGTTSPDYKLDVNGDVRLEEAHKLYFGGTGVDADVNLYKSATDTLKTDDAFIAAAGITSNAVIESTSGGFKFPDGTTQTSSAQNLSFRSVSSSTSITATDDTVVVSGNSAAVTLTLPAASTVTAGRKIVIKDGGLASTYNIAINRAGSDTIDGQTSMTLAANYSSITLVSNGSNAYYLI